VAAAAAADSQWVAQSQAPTHRQKSPLGAATSPSLLCTFLSIPYHPFSHHLFFLPPNTATGSAAQ